MLQIKTRPIRYDLRTGDLIAKGLDSTKVLEVADSFPSYVRAAHPDFEDKVPFSYEELERLEAKIIYLDLDPRKFYFWKRQYEGDTIVSFTPTASPRLFDWEEISYREFVEFKLNSR